MAALQRELRHSKNQNQPIPETDEEMMNIWQSQLQAIVNEQGDYEKRVEVATKQLYERELALNEKLRELSKIDQYKDLTK